MFRLLHTILFFVLIIGLARGEEVIKRIYPSNISTTVGIGSVDLRVPYLSPNLYRGWEGRIVRKKFRLIPRLGDYRFFSTTRVNGGLSFHPTKLNSMLHLSGYFLLGIQHRWVLRDNLQIFAGSGWEFGLGGKYLARNINNPVSLDFNTGCSAVADANYSCRVWSVPLSIGYGVRIPLLGAMFVPHKGATYYEIFVLKNSHQTIHLSTPHNRQAISQYLDVDIKLKPLTVKIGLQHDVLRYKANGMVFDERSLIFHIGTSFRLYRLWGRKN